MWKTLSTKEILKHPRLTVIEDEFETEKGIRGKYLHYKHDKNVAFLLCKRADGKMLLQKEYCYPSKEKYFMLPGGAVPLDEKIGDGANRELMEEAGFRADSLELLGNYSLNIRKSKGLVYVFLATDLKEASLPGDPEEEIETYWFNEDEIEQKIINGDIHDPNILAAWTLYKLKKTF